MYIRTYELIVTQNLLLHHLILTVQTNPYFLIEYQRKCEPGHTRLTIRFKLIVEGVQPLLSYFKAVDYLACIKISRKIASFI